MKVTYLVKVCNLIWESMNFDLSVFENDKILRWGIMESDMYLQQPFRVGMYIFLTLRNIVNIWDKNSVYEDEHPNQ